MLGELRRWLSVCVCVLLCPIAAASAATIDVPLTSSVDMKRPGPQGTFNYFELHRTTLAAGGVGFFIYKGRCGNEHA
jgi:hypothetical protein